MTLILKSLLFSLNSSIFEDINTLIFLQYLLNSFFFSFIFFFVYFDSLGHPIFLYEDCFSKTFYLLLCGWGRFGNAAVFQLIIVLAAIPYNLFENTRLALDNGLKDLIVQFHILLCKWKLTMMHHFLSWAHNRTEYKLWNRHAFLKCHKAYLSSDSHDLVFEEHLLEKIVFIHHNYLVLFWFRYYLFIHFLFVIVHLLLV